LLQSKDGPTLFVPIKPLTDARVGGSNQHEAEEIALPNILLESESEERARVLEELEKMEEV